MRKSTLKRKLESNLPHGQQPMSKSAPNSPRVKPIGSPDAKLGRQSSKQSVSSRKLVRKSSKQDADGTPKARKKEQSRGNKDEGRSPDTTRGEPSRDLIKPTERRIKLPPGVERSSEGARAAKLSSRVPTGSDGGPTTPCHTDVKRERSGEQRRLKLPPGHDKDEQRRLKLPPGHDKDEQRRLKLPPGHDKDEQRRSKPPGHDKDEQRRLKLPPGHDNESPSSRGGKASRVSSWHSGGFGEEPSPTANNGRKKFGNPVEAARLGFGVRSPHSGGSQPHSYNSQLANFRGAAVVEDIQKVAREKSWRTEDPRRGDDVRRSDDVRRGDDPRNRKEDLRQNENRWMSRGAEDGGGAQKRAKIELMRNASTVDDAPPGPPPPQPHMAIPPPPAAPDVWGSPVTEYARPRTPPGRGGRELSPNSRSPGGGDIPPPPPLPPGPTSPPTAPHAAEPHSPELAPATPPTPDAAEEHSFLSLSRQSAHSAHDEKLPLDSPEYDPNSPMASPTHSPE